MRCLTILFWVCLGIRPLRPSRVTGSSREMSRRTESVPFRPSLRCRAGSEGVHVTRPLVRSIR